MERPIVGISMGDPFGNGPEITVKALNDPEVYKTCRPLVWGIAPAWNMHWPCPERSTAST